MPKLSIDPTINKNYKISQLTRAKIEKALYLSKINKCYGYNNKFNKAEC